MSAEPDRCPICGQKWFACGETLCPQPKKPSGVEIISKHSTQIGGVTVNFTVGRIK